MGVMYLSWVPREQVKEEPCIQKHIVSTGKI